MHTKLARFGSTRNEEDAGGNEMHLLLFFSGVVVLSLPFSNAPVFKLGLLNNSSTPAQQMLLCFLGDHVGVTNANKERSVYVCLWRAIFSCRLFFFTSPIKASASAKPCSVFLSRLWPASQSLLVFWMDFSTSLLPS